MLRRVLVLGAVLVGLLVGTAQAEPFNPRLDLALAIANDYWGGPPPMCSSLLTEEVGMEEIEGVEEVGLATQPGPEPVPCELKIWRGLASPLVSFAETCEVMIHEDGHLHGLGHSEDSASPMYPILNFDQPICLRANQTFERLELLRERLHLSPPRRHRELRAAIRHTYTRLWRPLLGY